ncbi:MAG: hypothetical protein GY953_11675, partial [bacterium]|nr:hypothetical protein [bacterium]
YYGNQGELEFDFVVAPGADPDRIALRFPGLSEPRIGEDGSLSLDGGEGELKLRPPVVYQNVDGERVLLAANYVRQPDGRIGFDLADYEGTLPLVIDPVLSFASYLGGSLEETAAAVVTDAEGNRYLTGATQGDFPATNSLQGSFGGSEAFVTKMSADGSTLLYSTYIGGSGDDVGLGIDVDAGGNVYLTGATRSVDFPTAQPVQAAFGGAGTEFGTDAFVLKLSADGSRLAAGER